MNTELPSATGSCFGQSERRNNSSDERSPVGGPQAGDNGQREDGIAGQRNKCHEAAERNAPEIQQCTDRTVPRSREETERERRELYERTAREVQEIVAEFHDRLPRQLAKAIGAVYCRYSTRFQDSIADQVRTILEEAVRRGIFVPLEYIFFDLAVRGYKSQRAGLDQLRQVLRSGTVSVVMFFATNRLFRKVHRTLEFVEEQLVEKGVDAIFVKSGVDTSDANRWRMLLTFHSMMDEFVVGMYADNIRAAHEGLLEKRLAFGTISYGYTGEPIEGQFTRRGRPRRRLAVDPVTSVVVAQIFVWYVVERRKINDIIQCLNDDPSIPLPPRCTSGMWTRLAVKGILTNPRYRALWLYGVTETVWISSKDYARQRVRREPLKKAQIEELRIVSDEIWFHAQRLLKEEPRNRGRNPSDGDRSSRPRILNGLLWCPLHDQVLHVGGPHGRSMICPSCRRLKPEKRHLFTYLNRTDAVRMTCEKLAELVRADEDIVQQIVEVSRREISVLQQPDPSRIEQVRGREQQLTKRIRFIMEHVGESDDDQRETAAFLTDLRQQRAEVRAELASLEGVSRKRMRVPSEQEVLELLDGLGGILTSAASGPVGDEAGLAHAIISDLTGGRIELFQMGERESHGGWLQGRFRVDVLSVVAERLTGTRLSAGDSGLEVVIDYRRPRRVDEQAEHAKALWDQGLLGKEIAKRMGCLPSYVTKLIHRWFDLRDLPRPDGRRRRAQLENKQVRIPTYKRIADEVMLLVDKGMSNSAIGRHHGVSDATVDKAIKWFCDSRGLPAPTTADRKLKMLRLATEMFHRNILIKDIAAELGYSPRGMKLALEEHLATLGESMPDGRARRGNAKSGEVASGHAAEPS